MEDAGWIGAIIAAVAGGGGVFYFAMMDVASDEDGKTDERGD